MSALAYGSILISLLVGQMLIFNLGLISFSMEGKSFWMIKASPVSAGKQLAAKFLVACLPSLGLGWLFLFVIVFLQRVPISTLLDGIPLTALFLAGLDGINLALGVCVANFTWTDPRHMVDEVAGYLGYIVDIAYLLVSFL